MSARRYVTSHGGHPAQTEPLTGRAVFTEAYAVIPRGVMRDIVTSCLPQWEETRAWIIARPMSGFVETFSQYIMEVGPRGGSDNPELDPRAEGAIVVAEGQARPASDAKPGGGLRVRSSIGIERLKEEAHQEAARGG